MAEPRSSRTYWQTRREVLAAIQAEAAADADPERSYLDLLEGLVVDAALERDGELAEARGVAVERDAALVQAQRAAHERETALDAAVQRAEQERDAALNRAEQLPREIHAWLNDLAVAHPDHAALISELAELFERRWIAERAGSASVRTAS